MTKNGIQVTTGVAIALRMKVLSVAPKASDGLIAKCEEAGLTSESFFHVGEMVEIYSVRPYDFTDDGMPVSYKSPEEALNEIADYVLSGIKPEMIGRCYYIREHYGLAEIELINKLLVSLDLQAENEDEVIEALQDLFPHGLLTDEKLARFIAKVCADNPMFAYHIAVGNLDHREIKKLLSEAGE